MNSPEQKHCMTRYQTKTPRIFYNEVIFIMKVKYAERGTFDAEKAARGLMELTNIIKKQNKQNKKENDKGS
jgi:hypothetical protein